MPKCVLTWKDSGEAEVNLPDDPIAAANIAVRLLDMWTGNSLGYPHVWSEKEWAEYKREQEAFETE